MNTDRKKKPSVCTCHFDPVHLLDELPHPEPGSAIGSAVGLDRDDPAQQDLFVSYLLLLSFSSSPGQSLLRVGPPLYGHAKRRRHLGHPDGERGVADVSGRPSGIGRLSTEMWSTFLSSVG